MAGIFASLWSLEGLAVVTALAYLLLAARESSWCWLYAFISSALYVVIMWDARLLTEAALNLFYVAMAVLGWFQWQRGGKEHAGLQIVSLTWIQHGALLALMLLLAAANGWAMQQWTSAAWPFVDSFITWSSVITTVLVVRKVLENWVYWFLIDALALVVYIDRGLYMTALLFALYLVIVVFGYYKWRREYLAAAKPE